MDSLKAYEKLKADAEAARQKAVQELETKKTALMGQVAEIDAQLASLNPSQTLKTAPGRPKGSGKGVMTEEKRLKLSEAAKRRWADKKKQA